MKIGELDAPATPLKAEWLAGNTWLSFTPVDSDQTSRTKRQSTIQRQFGNRYVIEYITETFGEPNSGFEEDPNHLAE